MVFYLPVNFPEFAKNIQTEFEKNIQTEFAKNIQTEFEKNIQTEFEKNIQTEFEKNIQTEFEKKNIQTYPEFEKSLLVLASVRVSNLVTSNSYLLEFTLVSETHISQNHRPGFNCTTKFVSCAPTINRLGVKW